MEYHDAWEEIAHTLLTEPGPISYDISLPDAEKWLEDWFRKRIRIVVVPDNRMPNLSTRFGAVEPSESYTEGDETR